MAHFNPVVTNVGTEEVKYHPTPVGVLFVPNEKKGEGLIGFYRTPEGVMVVFPHAKYQGWFKVGEINTVLLPTDDWGAIPKGLRTLIAIPVSVLYQ